MHFEALFVFAVFLSQEVLKRDKCYLVSISEQALSTQGGKLLNIFYKYFPCTSFKSLSSAIVGLRIDIESILQLMFQLIHISAIHIFINR